MDATGDRGICMAIVTREKGIITIGTGKPPFPIEKLAVLPKNERPAVQQPASHQPEKRKFFTSTPVLVGGAILLGLGALTIANRNATDTALHRARVMDLQPLYAGADSAKLETLAKLSKKYRIDAYDMLLITKIAKKLNMDEEGVLAVIRRNAEQLKKPSFDRTGVGGRDGEVLSAFDRLSSDYKEKVLESFKAADIQ